MYNFFVRTLGTFFLLLCIYTHCSAQIDSTVTLDSTFAKANYKISYPATWKLDDSGKYGAEFFIFSAKDSETDSFGENVNLIIQDINTDTLTLRKYTNISVKQINALMKNSVISENGTEINNNKKYQRIVYEGDVNYRHLKFIQYYCLENNKAYVLTLTTHISTFEKYKLLGEKILSSFTFQ